MSELRAFAGTKGSGSVRNLPPIQLELELHAISICEEWHSRQCETLSVEDYVSNFSLL